MPTSVNAPDGTQINFPDDMGDDAIKAIMRKKYPPMTVMQPSRSEQTNPMSSAQFSSRMGTPMPAPVPNYEQMAEQQEANAIQPKKYPVATMSAVPQNADNYLQDLLSDVRSGGGSTAPGRLLRSMGAHGTSSGVPDSIGEFIGGPMIGPVRIAHGSTQLPTHPLRGANEMIGGAMQTIAPLMGATSPEFLPMAGAFTGISEGTTKVGNALGLDPDVTELAGTMAGLAAMGGIKGYGETRGRLVEHLSNQLVQQGGVTPEEATNFAHDMVTKYEATGDAKYINYENQQAPGLGKMASMEGQRLAAAAAEAAKSSYHPTGTKDESDVDMTTRRPPMVEQPESIDSKIANAQMRIKNAPPLSNKKADLLNILDQHLQEKAASQIGQTAAQEIQPGSASAEIKDVRSLMEASEMKEAPETPEQSKAARDRYLNLTKGEPIGPVKSYDPITGQEVNTIPSPKTGSQPSDTDHMARALQELYPDVARAGDLPSGDLSKVILRAQEYKEQAFKIYTDSKQQSGGTLGPTGAFKAVPAGMESQRGSLWFKPKRVPNSSSPLGQLTDKIQQGLGTHPPGGDRLSLSEKLVDSYGPTGDAIKSGLQRLTAHTAGLVDKYLRPSKYTDYDRAMGEFTGDLQRNGLESRRFVANIMHEVPDKLRREAITNYVQANGDKTLLANQAAQTKDSRLRRGYEVAAQLTPAEEALATQVKSYFDNQLHEAQSAGILTHGVENYVNQIWKKGDEPRGLLTAAYNNDLRPNPDLIKKRLFQDYFEGEQAGLTPRSKDIGYLVTAYNKSFSQALASRAFISKLAAGKRVPIANAASGALKYKWTGALADDGRPIIAAPASTGRTIDGGADPDTHLVFPRVAPEEDLEGYRTINHPALSNWKWAGSDDVSGANTFVKGQLQVHPDFYNKIDRAFKTSALKRSPVASNIMKVSSAVKGTLLSFSAFHQVQEGVHAAFHMVNPFHPAEIDLTDATTNKLLDHGLIVGGDTGIQDFAEGLHGQGLTKYVPGLGALGNKYSQYLFGDYIPRLKTAMAKAAYERNTSRYSGKYTDDQIARLSAEQSNAAFGELNYKMLGRDPSTQDMLRFILLAPDFLEARARFVGQALRPDGAEQRAALLRGAAGMYATARIVNKVLDENSSDLSDVEGYHFDVPFGIVHGDREYTLRSVPGDIQNLINDKGSFVNHRLNPLTVRPFDEFRSGKDAFGRKRDMEGQIMDFVKNVVPIPFQTSAQKAMEKGFNQSTAADSVLGATGITSKKYRTLAGRLAHQYVMDSMSPNHESRGIGYMAQKIQTGKFDSDEATQLIQAGKMTPDDLVKAMDMASEPEILRDFDNPNIGLQQAVEIYGLASEKERGILGASFASKLSKIDQLPQDQQEQISKMLNRIRPQSKFSRIMTETITPFKPSN